MSYPRAGCVWVCKTGITIVNKDHLGVPLYAKPLASLVFPSHDEFDDQVIGRALRKEEPERKKKVKVCGSWGG